MRVREGESKRQDNKTCLRLSGSGPSALSPSRGKNNCMCLPNPTLLMLSLRRLRLSIPTSVSLSNLKFGISFGQPVVAFEFYDMAHRSLHLCCIIRWRVPLMPLSISYLLHDLLNDTCYQLEHSFTASKNFRHKSHDGRATKKVRCSLARSLARLTCP